MAYIYQQMMKYSSFSVKYCKILYSNFTVNYTVTVQQVNELRGFTVKLYSWTKKRKIIIIKKYFIFTATVKLYSEMQLTC